MLYRNYRDNVKEHGNYHMDHIGLRVLGLGINV